MAKAGSPNACRGGRSRHVRCWIYHTPDGHSTGKLGPQPPVEETLPDAVLTPAPTLPGDVTVPETLDADELATAGRDEHARYRRRESSLPLVLGTDDAPADIDDPHGHPRP